MFVNWIVLSLGNWLALRNTKAKFGTFVLQRLIGHFFAAYYGISMSTPNLSGDPVIAFILSALVELPGYIAVALLIGQY